MRRCDKTTDVTLAYKREVLLDDIRNYLYIEGSVVDTGDDHKRHMIQDGGEDGNVDVLDDVLQLAYAQVLESLYPFTYKEVADGTIEDAHEEIEEFDIRLKLPQIFSQTTLNYLHRLIHNLMAYRAVYEWLTITNPEKSGVWMVKIEDAQSEIMTCVSRRIGGGIRRRQRPF